MLCSKCNTVNDADALFCIECGTPLSGVPREERSKGRRAYLFALLLIPVVAATLGVGYYKYILPQGVAATVNGEQITISELEAAVCRARAQYALKSEGEQEAQQARSLRYRVLDNLIMERVVLQEARKANINVDTREAEAAAEQIRLTSGMGKEAFNAAVIAPYGSLSSFEEAMRRELLVKKFIAEHIAPRGVDAKTAAEAVDHWMQNAYAGAAVRITLAEQMSGAACGCCNGKELKNEQALHVQ